MPLHHLLILQLRGLVSSHATGGFTNNAQPQALSKNKLSIKVKKPYSRYGFFTPAGLS